MKIDINKAIKTYKIMSEEHPYNIETCRPITEDEKKVYELLTWNHELTEKSFSDIEKALETLTEHYDLFCFFHMLEFMVNRKIYDRSAEPEVMINFIVESADLIKHIYLMNAEKDPYYDSDGLRGSHINDFPKEVQSLKNRLTS